MRKTILSFAILFACAFTATFAQDGMRIGSTNAPAEMLHVEGAIVVGSDFNGNTNAPLGGKGTIRWNDAQTRFEGWDGTTWVTLSGGGADDQTAAEVPVTPIGNLSSTDVQAALEELQSDIDNSASTIEDVLTNGNLAADGQVLRIDQVSARDADGLLLTDDGNNGIFIKDGGSIGINNPLPDASAILDIISTNKGILIPRMTYIQQQAIASPANGLLVFNTTSDCLDIYTDGAWQSIYCSCPTLQSLNAITGASTVCSGTVQSYSVPAVSGASDYTWTVTGVPAGNITGNGSSTISFSAPATSTYTVSVTASNACNSSSVSKSLLVNAYTNVPPTPVWSPTPTDICAGGNYNYAIANNIGINGTTSINYTWTITATGSATATLTANSQTASAGTPVTYTAVASAITLTHGSGLGTITVTVAGNNTCGSTAAPLSFTQNIVGQPTVDTAPTSSQSVCTGAAITLTSGTLSGTGNYTYQWYFNTTASSSGATAIAGATGTIASGVATTNYVLNTANGSGASPAGTGFVGTYYYYCNFTPLNSTSCGPVQSGFAQVIVVAQPTVTTQPAASTTVCVGGGVTLTAATAGTGNYTYQWYYNTSNSNTGGTAVAGATGTVGSTAPVTYSLVMNNSSTASPAGTGQAGTYYYYCTFSPQSGTNCGPISSSVATVEVKGIATISTEPAATQTVCTAASVTLSAVPGGTGSYTYQWYYNTSNSTSGGTVITGATGTVASGAASNYLLVTTNTTAASPAGTGIGGTFYYYCIFSPQGTTNCGPITTSVATVEVNTRSADPTSATVSTAIICNGQSTTLTLNGGGGGTGEVITWYSGSCGGALVGTGNSLSVSPTLTTTYYGRYETPVPCSYNSICRSVTVTVNQPSVAPTALNASPATICIGSSSTLTQSGGSLGTGAVWKWYSDDTYTTLVGTGTGATASLTVSPTTTTKYWLRIENTSSPCTATLDGPGAGTAVSVDQTSVLGTISNAGPIDFCSSVGDWSSVPISVSGSVGTINWQYGWSNATGGNAPGGNGWQLWSPIGPSPAYSTFSKKTALSDTDPDRVRWTVTNGVCPTAGPSAGILLKNRYNEDPASLASSQNNYCTGTVSNLTLTATFPTATNVLGTVQFYSGSCPTGTLIATVAGNGSTTVTTPNITAPTSTTDYYVRYDPGTGSGCAPGNCISTTVTVSQLAVAGSVTQSPVSGSHICAGNPVEYTLSGQTGTFNYFEYQWNTTAGVYSGSWGGTNPYTWVSGTNGASILYVRAVVSSGACPTVYTAPVNVTVDAVAVAGTVTQSPVSGSHVCNGAAVTYTNSGITGTFDSYEYQWNTTTGSYTPSWIATNPATWNSSLNGISTLYVRSKVTNGVCPTVYSAPVNVTVDALSVAGSITQSPASGGTVCSGLDVTYTLSGQTGTFNQYKYQWNASGGVPSSYVNWYASNPATWPSGQNGASVLYVIGEVTNGVCPPAYTAPVNVTVQSTANAGGAIAVTSPICVGGSSSITNVTAASTGTPASAGPDYYYYWQRTTSPVVGWTLYEGPTAALTSALPSAVTGTAGTYELVRNSAFGCAGQVNSNVLTLTVNGAPAAPTSVSASPSTITQGNSTNLNATSAGNTIEWYTTSSGGSSVGTSASGANFGVTPLATTTYYAGANSSSPTSQTFTSVGSASFVVPSGVTSITIEAWGAQGGSGGFAGGLGGYAAGTLSVTPGATYSINVGGQPTTGAGSNGGGSSGGCGGGGGGASDVRNSGGTKLIVAGGGGGGGCTVSGYTGSAGGVGGGLTGGSSAQGSGGTGGSSGGTQSAGGTSTGCCGTGSNGSAGTGGNGAPGGCSGAYAGYGGGGGGGYYGGGGGGNCGGNLGGGGGSSYTGGVSGATNTAGQRSGNGQVKISWNVVGCGSGARTPVTVTVNACSTPPGSQTFNYTGSQQTWVVPCTINSVSITCYGAQGGSASGGVAGQGGTASGTLAVSPGQTLYIYVGGQGGANGTAGYNGGGLGYAGAGDRGGGGGASDVRYGGNTVVDRKIVAGGGGGNYSTSYSPGGAGGGATGGAGGGLINGFGGTQSGGGTGGFTGPPYDGTLGQGGGSGAYSISGGGGGYYGGGSGLAGGGGSGYVGGVTGGSTSNGGRSGNGQVILSW